MFFQKFTRRNSRRPKFFPIGRSLRYESMEGRLVLSASGFSGNECAPELNDGGLDAIIPSQNFSPQTEIAFEFNAADVVNDGGAGATAVEDIRFALDPDIGTRTNGATPAGATLNFNDQGTTDIADDRWEFSWTPDVDQVGTFRLFLIATDDGGTDNVPLSDVYAFNLDIDNRPTVDLNGDNDSGIDFGPVAFTEADDSVPVSLVDDDLSIPFADNDMVASATVQLVDPQADGLEVLGITAGASLVVDDSTPGQLVITVDGGGLADKSVFEDALRTLTYHNTSDNPAATRTINVTINDGTADSAAAVTTVDITATNDRPNLTLNGNPADAMVGVEYVLQLMATDPDGGDLLTFRLVSGPAGAVISPLPAGGSDTTEQISEGQDGFYRAEIRWTPTAEQGDDSPFEFLVVATDTGGLVDSKVYEVAVANQNPVANEDPAPQDDPIIVDEDAGDTAIGDILANDTDADGDSFTVHSVTAGGSTFDVGVAFTHPNSGAEILVAANGQVNYNPNGQFENLSWNQSAEDSFQYTIIDEQNNESAPATVTITINGSNDAPTATNTVPEFRISEDAGATILDLTALLMGLEDVDAGDTHSVVAAPDNPTEGGLFALDGNLTFDPNGEFQVGNGAEQTIDFQVTLRDNSDEMSEVTVDARIIIEGVNEAPTAVNDADYDTDEDSTLTVDTRETGILANDTDDADNAGLTVAEVNGDSANVGAPIVVSDGDGRIGQLTVNSDGTFTFAPGNDFDALPQGQSSQVTFTYRASDGAAENDQSNEATVTITVDGLNDAPVAANVGTAAVEDGPAVNSNFNALDADEGEMANLTFEVLSQPTEGMVTNNNDGTFDFDPLDDFQDLAEGVTRQVTFNYRAVDPQTVASDEAMATITVTGVNDAPQFDLNEQDGLASTMPTGSLQAPKVIAVELDLTSTDPNVFSLNMLDIPNFTSDVDGDNFGISLAEGDNGGTPFRNANRPILNASSQLVWTPTAEDIGEGYVIRVQAQDQPAMGGALSDSFDIVVSVSTGNPSVMSVSNIDVSLADSEINILFDEAMGASALTTSNYTLSTVDGTVPVDTDVSILSATENGADGVILELSDATINDLSNDGVTKLKLTFSPLISDLGGNGLSGDLEFEVDLLLGQAN